MSNSLEQSLWRRYLDDLSSAEQALKQFNCNHVVSHNTATVMAERKELEGRIARLKEGGAGEVGASWLELEFIKLMDDSILFLKNK